MSVCLFIKIVLQSTRPMRKFLLIPLFLCAFSGCLNEKQQAEHILQHYIDLKVELIRNYAMESAVALWNATVSGNETDYQKLIDIELNFNKSNRTPADLFAPDRFYARSANVFANKQDFELMRKLKYSGLITDSLLSRQLNVLYQAFMGPQIETEKYRKLIDTEIKLWQAFFNFKIELDGKKYGAGAIDSIQKNTGDAAVLNQIFHVFRQKGSALAPTIIRMVKDRNEFAVHFGYPDFYHLILESKDQTPERIQLLLDEIERNTRNPYFELKQETDQVLAERFHIRSEDLQPWHYDSEQTAALSKENAARMDSLFSDIDPVEKTAAFFDGIGLPIRDVIDNSDLEYRREKSSINAMINVDFKNDIRLISGIQHTHSGMWKMMHLGGHASHYTSIADDIPYLLKTPIPVIYEGVARYFESLATDCNWLKTEMPLHQTGPDQLLQACRRMQQVTNLFRCRKLLVLACFEREIYRNPDQDPDLLWQKLNLDYLGIDYPAEKCKGYWASNKYSTSLSCTTHNFVLADVFAAQLQHTIGNRVLSNTNGVYSGNKAIGQYLTENLYRYGNLLPWEQLIEKATGEPLHSKYFVNQLVGDETNNRNTEN